ncbi:MAG: hypothetical protein ACKOXX_06495, partial [Actinomycetota bacterium]
AVDAMSGVIGGFARLAVTPATEIVFVPLPACTRRWLALGCRAPSPAFSQRFVGRSRVTTLPREW